MLHGSKTGLCRASWSKLRLNDLHLRRHTARTDGKLRRKKWQLEISIGTALEERLWTWSQTWWEPFKWWKVCVKESDKRRFSSSIWCLFKWVKGHVSFLFLHDNSLGLGSHNLTVDWTFPFDLSLLWDQLRFNWSFCLYLCFDSWRLARAWLISI